MPRYERYLQARILPLEMVEPNAVGLSLAFHEEGSRLRAPRDAELLKHIRQIVLDRLVAEAQSDCDFLVRLPLGHQRDNPFFLGRQLI